MGIVATNDFIKLMLERAFDASATRTPIATFGVGTGQSEPQVTDTSMDGQEQFDAGVGNYKSPETDYPSLDTTLLQTTWRGIVADTQANGLDLDSGSLWNADSTKLLCVLGTHTEIEKNNGKRIIYVFKVDLRQSIEVN